LKEEGSSATPKVMHDVMRGMEETDEVKFIADLRGEDELGVVIRAQIYIETHLLRLIELLVPHPEHLEKMHLDYFQKVQLAVAMGLSPEYAVPLKTIGSIRNRFAHKLDSRLTKSDAENLYKALGANDKDVVQKTFERTKEQVSPSLPVKFKHLKPKDQFVLLVVTLRAMLLVAIAEAERRLNGA
jgi:hypothetical protein